RPHPRRARQCHGGRARPARGDVDARVDLPAPPRTDAERDRQSPVRGRSEGGRARAALLEALGRRLDAGRGGVAQAARAQARGRRHVVAVERLRAAARGRRPEPVLLAGGRAAANAIELLQARGAAPPLGRLRRARPRGGGAAHARRDRAPRGDARRSAPPRLSAPVSTIRGAARVLLRGAVLLRGRARRRDARLSPRRSGGEHRQAGGAAQAAARPRAAAPALLVVRAHGRGVHHRAAAVGAERGAGDLPAGAAAGAEDGGGARQGQAGEPQSAADGAPAVAARRAVRGAPAASVSARVRPRDRLLPNRARRGVVAGAQRGRDLFLRAARSRAGEVLAVLEGVMAGRSYAYGLVGRLAGRPPSSELADVIEHLEHLLNTRKDYGSFLDGFGLEITDWMWSANPMLALGQHLCEAIARFEPRVAEPRIELLERD